MAWTVSQIVEQEADKLFQMYNEGYIDETTLNRELNELFTWEEEQKCLVS